MTATMQFSPETEHQAREQLSALLNRSTTDMAFRARLLSEPNAAYAEQTGSTLPAHVRLAFVENRGMATVVLPPFGQTTSELSDADLETVAGGTVEPVSACVVGLVFLTGVAVGLWGVEKIVSTE